MAGTGLMTVADSELDPLKSENLHSNVFGCFFNAHTVAIVGATEKSGPGRALSENARRGGTVYYVNARSTTVLGQPAYKSLSDCPTLPDCAVIVTPGKFIPAIVEEAAKIGIRAVVVISAGFKEIGAEGIAREEQLLNSVKSSGYRTRIIGPNCVGVMSPLTGWNLTFCTQMALKGNLAVISQSGAMITSILDWTVHNNVGFSYFVSVGSMLDIDWADLLEFFGEDASTKAIIVYMESIGNAHRFLTAARQVSFRKPIVVLKSGRTAGAAAAAISHTGSLTGSDDALNEALKRAGVIRVDTMSELFSVAQALSMQPLPKGPRLSIVSHAGGPGVLATDALEMNNGVLAKISPDTMERLNEILPAEWSHGNPIDMLGGSTSMTYASVLDVVSDDPNTDAVLVMMVPVAVASPVQIALAIIAFQDRTTKPVFACFMGGEEMQPARSILARNGVPSFEYSDEAARVFTLMWKYNENLQNMYTTVKNFPLTDEAARRAHDGAKSMLAQWRAEKKVIVPEAESKELLSLYEIPVARTVVCVTAEEAVKESNKMGYPVVLKIHSEIITHKSDMGGVILNIENDKGVSDAFETIKANVEKNYPGKLSTHFLGVSVQPFVDTSTCYELILGSHFDPQIGPVIVFGYGGVLVEVMKDTALALPPLNHALALQMIQKCKIYKALLGVRGRKSVDIDKLANVIINFSQMVSQHREIAEIDINPLLVSDTRIVAVDARVVLHKPDVDLTTLPEVPIRPYPSEYIWMDKLRDETPVVIRPLRPEDEETLKEFHTRLSDDLVLAYFRHPVPVDVRTSHSRIIQILSADYSTSINLAIIEKESRKMAATARIKKNQDGTANLFILVAIGYSGQGIGRHLFDYSIRLAAAEGITALVMRGSKVLPFAEVAIALARRAGFMEISQPSEEEYVCIRSLAYPPGAADGTMEDEGRMTSPEFVSLELAQGSPAAMTPSSVGRPVKSRRLHF